VIQGFTNRVRNGGPRGGAYDSRGNEQ
jgi:hypothetical protein